MTDTENTPRDDRAAIDKAFSLLTCFGEQAASGIGVSELARRASLSKSTAFRVLNLLERNGVVERVGSSYRFGQRLHDLGAAVYSPEQDRIREVLTPFLADLYEFTHETVHLATLHGTDVVYLAKLYGHRRVPAPSRVGGRVPAHCTAIGKALIANDPEVFEMITSNTHLQRLTERTVVDVEELSLQLHRIRREGLAFEIEESAPGLACVAVPVFGVGNRAIAGLSVSGPAAGFDPRSHAAALRRVSHAASQALRRAGVGATVRLPHAAAS
ncbi:IclR family transcriptional regulator [Nocardioides pocheonensis]|uniref:IclR family transcriptional regulator n=1 Tax=Nocardioides pocheonensis TaxID=661485 RepID=A0A3N0GHY9_9ACTN|nr:IclR family transcriptional regulator [Nocardioides pocheonensis]RNM12104.1 IclR family transcriptional regulator [Nocardioides pocheonensis]